MANFGLSSNVHAPPGMGGLPGSSGSIPGATGGAPSLPDGAASLGSLGSVMPTGVASQVAAGQKIASAIQSGDTTSLASAGISLAGTLVQSSGDQYAMNFVGGALAGLLSAGPTGAVMGAIVGAAEDLSSALQGYQGVVEVNGVSEATWTIAQDVAGLAGVKDDQVTHVPAGWHLADYLSTFRPPSKSKRIEQFFNMINATWSTVPPSFATYSSPSSGMLQSPPLCTPIFWYWSAPGSIVDCNENLTFGSGGAGDPNSLMSAMLTATYALPKTSAKRIVQRALLRAPDPSYFASGLYGFQSGNGTIYTNPDLLNAMATVLWMLATGASTRSIVSELLLQRHILASAGTESPSDPAAAALGFGGSSMWGTTPGTTWSWPGGLTKLQLADRVQYGFSCLLADYILLAAAEDKAKGDVSMASIVSANPITLGPAPGLSGPKVPTKVVSESRKAAAATIRSYLARYLGRHPR